MEKQYIMALDEGTTGAVLAFSLAGILMLTAGWFGWQQWGFLPKHPVKKVMVPVTLPPDANGKSDLL